ncbi:hypothetical protein HJ590_04415 [Naumannella sp. ID2617S]|nr:hypothetical protein [Naumannella sp. ID2617S]
MARSSDDEFDPTADDGSFETLDPDDLVDPDDVDDPGADEDDIEPGSEGAYGTGVEGADQILEDERVRTSGEEINEWADFDGEFGQDDSAAAEQGNRDQDEMVSEGDDPLEVDQLSGDALGDGDGPTGR